MLTRSKAKMTSSSDSMNFQVNNPQGVPDNKDDDSPIKSQMTEETSNIRARGQESQPQEEVTLRALMDFMNEKFDKQNEKFEKQKEEANESLKVINENNLKVINEKFDKQNEKLEEVRREQNENNKVLSEKLDKHKEEVMQQMAEQITLLRTEIREYTSTWNDNRSEVQQKQEDVNKNYEEVHEPRETDNIVDFKDVSVTKKLSTVGSNVSVSSNRRNKWIKKRDDFISLHLTMSEDDYPDVDKDSESVIPSSGIRKKHELSNTRIDATSVRPTMKYPACGTDIHRLISRAASVRSMKRKFNIKMNTACYETCLLYTSRCV